MGGGSANQTDQTSAALANTEATIAQQYLQQSQNQIAAGNALEQPAINYYQSVLSGNQNSLLTAAAPQISNITQQSQAAQGNIRNNVPVGAGQDYALAQAQVSQGSQTANALNNSYLSALTNLTQIGAAQTGVGLSEGGLGVSGIGGAQQAYGNIAQNQAASKASTLSFLGSIVGGGAGVGAAALGG